MCLRSCVCVCVWYVCFWSFKLLFELFQFVWSRIDPFWILGVCSSFFSWSLIHLENQQNRRTYANSIGEYFRLMNVLFVSLLESFCHCVLIALELRYNSSEKHVDVGLFLLLRQDFKWFAWFSWTCWQIQRNTWK